MATSGSSGSSSASAASAPQPQPVPSNSDQTTWDGDEMFNIFLLDYCKKRGYHKAASQLVTEADIPAESEPPINAQQGLLFEWWSVFWMVFQAKHSLHGSDDAMLYHKHQKELKARALQLPPPSIFQPPGRSSYPLPNGVASPVPPLPNAHINVFTSAGPPPSHSAPPFGPANLATQLNAVPGPSAPPSHPGQPYSGGMAGRASLGSQHRLLGGGPPYQSPTIPLFSQSQGYYQQPPAGSMSLLGRSPYMGTINRATMPPPNGLQQGPGPAGSTPTLAFQHQTLFRNDQSPPDRKRQRMTTPNPADHQLQQPQSQSQSQPQQPQHLQQQSQSQPLPLQQSQQAPQPSQQGQHQLSMAPIGPLSSDLQPVTGVGSVQGIPMIGAPGPSQAPSGSGAPPTHQMSQLNIPLNPAGSASMSTPLLNSAPLSNPQPPPPTASAPLPTPTPPPPAAGPEPITDLLLDMSEMSSNGDADSDFDPDILDDLELWFDPTDVDDDDSFLDMVITKPRFDPIRKSDPWLDPIVMHDGPSLDTT